MSNGSWVDVASKAIIQVGFPTVVAGVLLWFLLTTFQHSMDTISVRMTSNTEVVAKLIANEEAILSELRAQSQELQYQTQYLRDLMDKSSRLLEQKHASRPNQP